MATSSPSRHNARHLRSAISARPLRGVGEALAKARASEAASKEALKVYCEQNGWRVVFFEGKTGAPRTGIIDAVAFRLARKNSDALEIHLIQLKGGQSGISGPEIARLKKAVRQATVNWMIAAYDGEVLHVTPE